VGCPPLHFLLWVLISVSRTLAKKKKKKMKLGEKPRRKRWGGGQLLWAELMTDDERTHTSSYSLLQSIHPSNHLHLSIHPAMKKERKTARAEFVQAREFSPSSPTPRILTNPHPSRSRRGIIGLRPRGAGGRKKGIPGFEEGPSLSAIDLCVQRFVFRP
jgi:hypothetical protein